MVVVAALYEFRNFPNFQEVRKPLFDLCHSHGVVGSLLLGKEGVNGTIAGTRNAIDTIKDHLVNTLGFKGLEYKESCADTLPFYRLKVKLKKEIVTLGVEGLDPNDKKGTYLNPQEWDALISAPDTVLVDTRNDYECRVGTFKNAINPEIKKFTDFPKFVEDNIDKWKGKKVAMFCTGGIRCEKSTSHMRHLGFDDVYHLKGGILKYIEETPKEKSLWDGGCYVFDHRVVVNHGLELTDYKTCGACREPISAKDRESNLYEHGVSCPFCHGKRTAKQLKTARDRQFQINLAKKRGTTHMGAFI